ncbi:DUF1772 domain-containing protein [Pectobacterium odoriferum]|uniref:DUF1772 domain-containing protein n=1 Tax=Pectobacterium odoriferum TaxID=78398 RepID=UPI00052ABDE8|nr:DUF1772 domain-containing protein [Pectobacterium odoriferum]AIU89026.1 hypothetical protein BCS7_13635 [Pectobacterium odoriferum]POE17311.1 hypothetical protein BV918_14175 [Pectobacterium odoriferum]POE34829.1 hypothetical protein BV922_12795 [Pectobacterium odoriferum]
MVNLPYISVLDIISLLVISLLVGAEICLTFFINPVILKLDKASLSKFGQLLTSRLATPFPIWNVLVLLFLVTEAFIRWGTDAFPLVTIACILWIAAAIFTLIFMLPLNTKLARQTEDMSKDEVVTVFTYWANRHLPRLCMLLTALVFYMVALYI